MPKSGSDTRQAIVEAAKTLFYRRGYFHTSFSDIVDATELSRGHIYHYFKTKEDIIKAVIEQRIAEYRALLRAWEQKYPLPRRRIERFVQMTVDNRSDLSRYGCPIGTLNAELGKEISELREAARPLFDVFRNWLAEQFRALGHNKKDADELAVHLLARAEGLSLIGHVYGDPKLLRHEANKLREWVQRL